MASARRASAPMHQMHPGGHAGKVQRFLHRRVAAANDDDWAAAVEEAVASGAGADAAAAKRLLGGQSQILGGGAGGDDEGVARISALLAAQDHGSAAQVGLGHGVAQHCGLEATDMVVHLRHEVRPLQPGGAARPVLHVRGGGELPADLRAGDERRLQVGAGGVEGGRVAGRPGAEDDEAMVGLFRGFQMQSPWAPVRAGLCGKV